MNHELDFPAGIWETFAKSRPPVRCSPGYLIYLQDTEATCFYFLKSGRVKSFIQSEDGAGPSPAPRTTSPPPSPPAG